MSLSLTFQQSNLLTEAVSRADEDAVEYLLANDASAEVLDREGLFLKDEFLRIVEFDNSVIDRVRMGKANKLRSLFDLYHKNKELPKLIPALNLENCNRLYDEFEREGKWKSVRKLYNKMDVHKLVYYLFSQDDVGHRTTVMNVLEVEKLSEVFKMCQEKENLLARIDDIEKLFMLYKMFKLQDDMEMMGTVLQLLPKDRLEQLFNFSKKKKNGLDILIEGFQ